MPFFDAHEVKLRRVLTDRGTEYCGNPEHQEYELYLAVEDVDHSCTKKRKGLQVAKLLDIEVDEFARMLPFIAVHGFRFRGVS